MKPGIAGADGRPHMPGLLGRLLRPVVSRVADQRGFTMIELLVVMVVLAVVSVSVLMIFTGLTNVFFSQETRIQNQDDARRAINQVARYVRSACSSADNMTSQSNAMATTDEQQIEFYCDIDGDGVAEKVRYYLSGENLRMQTAAPVKLAAAPYYQYPAYETNGIVVQDAIRNGATPVFTYYYYINPGVLAEFTPSSSDERQKVVTVAISFIVNSAPELASSNVELATEVQIRQRYEGGLE